MPHLALRQVIGSGQQVHHPAEQHRIEKLQTRNHQIGESQKPRDPNVAPQKAEHAAISF